MSDLKVNDTKIVIKKGQGITYALQDLVKSKPNSILSDGKITLKEWHSTMYKLAEINEKRVKAKQAPIFTGGTDKTKAGWHTSFVVHPNQEINLSEEKIQSLYSAMGVTFKAEAGNMTAGKGNTNNTAASDSLAVAKPDSTAVAKQDSLAVARQDSTLALNADSTAVARQDSTLALNADSTAVAQQYSTITATNEDATPSVAELAPKKGRHELSSREIGKIGLESAKNFVKGMFFDEKGFSPARAAMTVGTVGALVLAAPVAAAAGASATVVAGVALGAKIIGTGFAAIMAYSGGKNIIQGTKNYYYNSTTEAEAKANMSQAMDGTVELAVALPAFLAVKGINNKAAKSAKTKATNTPESTNAGTPALETAPAAETAAPKKGFFTRMKESYVKNREARLGQRLKKHNEPVGEPEVTESVSGLRTREVNASGRLLKEIMTDASGNMEYTTVLIRNAKGKMMVQCRTNADNSKLELFYNKKGDVFKEIVTDASGNMEYTEVITRNAKNKVISELRTYADKSTLEYKYDGKGNKIETIKMDAPDKPAMEPAAEVAKPTEALLNLHNEIVSTETGFFESGAYFEVGYNHSRIAVKRTVFDNNTAAKKILYTESSTCDTHGNVIELKVDWASGVKDVIDSTGKGVRTESDGTRYNIKFKDNSITMLDKIES